MEYVFAMSTCTASTSIDFSRRTVLKSTLGMMLVAPEPRHLTLEINGDYLFAAGSPAMIRALVRKYWRKLYPKCEQTFIEDKLDMLCWGFLRKATLSLDGDGSKAAHASIRELEWEGVKVRWALPAG